jgi:glycosyltransferase involved in cell wall biosynthesis
MTTIKVLHLIDSAGLYGAERVILALLEELRGSRYPGVLGCIQERNNNVPAVAVAARLLGIPVVYFKMRRGLNPYGIRCILKYINEQDIRIVHSHGYKPNIFLGLLYVESFKRISTIHGWSKESAGLRGKTYELLDAISLKAFDAIVAVSHAVANDLRKRGIKDNAIKVIYNGLKISKEKPAYDISNIRQRFGLEDNSFVVGTVGRLESVKGHSYLIKAISSVAEEIKHCNLLIAGEGSLRDSLMSTIQKYNLTDRVRLVGYVSDLDQFLSMIDLFVLPSLSEGLPISLLEAMAAEKPIIASAVGGMLEIIESGKEGLLVPPADALSLAESIKKLYYNRTLMSDMAMRGKSIVENKYTVSIMAKHYMSSYATLIP